jgi:hypothetical protein
MERQTITKRIGEILSDVARLSNALYAMDTTDIQRYPDNYEILSTDAALRGEKIACSLRHLLYGSTTIAKKEYLNSAGVIHGIEIKNTHGIVEITLPNLLPKRKQRHSSEFLLDPLYFTLDRYADSNPLPKFRHCVVCFSHVYNRELPERRVRDYDNMELKQILDVVSTFVMTDDGGILCDAYNTTELGDTDSTVISVMDKDRFPEWLEARKKSMESIRDFSE